MGTKVTDAEFLKAWQKFGSPQAVSEALKLTIRSVYSRRQALAGRGHELVTFNPLNKKVELFYSQTIIPENRRIINHEVKNGHVFIASDCHYWPGDESIAHKALVKLINEMKPTTIVLNGDVFDGARISRHEPLYGTNPPTPKQEIEACVDRLHEIKNASKNAKTFYTFGNHDVRLWRYIHQNAPELSDAMQLFDYFPGWLTCWRLDINHSTIIKHRWHNGVHAGYNNALKAMLNTQQGSAAIVTGHLHRLMISNWRGFSGTAYGIDCGSLADPEGEQFAYLEGNPTPWAQGFCVLTFKDGKLLPPELCEVNNGVAYFRGKEV